MEDFWRGKEQICLESETVAKKIPLNQQLMLGAGGPKKAQPEAIAMNAATGAA